MSESIFDVAAKLEMQQFRFWYQPLDLLVSPKPDNYLLWNQNSRDIKKLTHRCELGDGYVITDPTSTPFLDEQILWTPVFYFSKNGDSFDLIPILKINVIPIIKNKLQFEMRESCRQIVDRKWHSIKSIQCHSRLAILAL